MATIKQVTTPIFPVSFPNKFEARKGFENSEPKFGLTAVFDPSKFSQKDKALWKTMQALADEVSMDAFKKPIKLLGPDFKKPLRDGAEKPELAGFGEGKRFCSLTTNRKPGLVVRDKDTGELLDITDPNDFYPGCYAKAKVTCYAYKNVGKGVAFGLQNVMKVADGPRLDGRADAKKDFADEEISEEDKAWLDQQEAEAAESDDGGF
jgi:hypothetical protein